MFFQDKDEEGKLGGVKSVPLDYVFKEELLNKGNTQYTCIIAGFLCSIYRQTIIWPYTLES